MPPDATASLCPVCLKRIDAERVLRGETVELVKGCPEHGEFRTIVWKGRPGLSAWRRPKTPLLLQPSRRRQEHGCPFDCGLCTEHRQRSCTVLLEVTRRCNLDCAVCFAGARTRNAADPGLDEIRSWFETARALAPASNIQISGGEPTVREDLPDIVAAGRKAGFGFLQLNTNGLRLAGDPGYAKTLREAGLASVFLQFDGISEAVHRRLRGRALASIKRRAIEACAAGGLGVVLVPTLVPGVNTDEVGSLLHYALELSPTVRGVHFQPVSYFGRYPAHEGGLPRITLPELMAAIEVQSGGLFKAGDFRPPGCEHAWCSFHAAYLRLPEGGVRRLPPPGGLQACCDPIEAEDGARHAVAHAASRWAGPTGDAGAAVSHAEHPMRLEDFLAQARAQSFTVSAMAFQDAWTLDLERLRECCIHVLDAGRGLVPFCAYNLTATDGRSLYRR